MMPYTERFDDFEILTLRFTILRNWRRHEMKKTNIVTSGTGGAKRPKDVYRQMLTRLQ